MTNRVRVAKWLRALYCGTLSERFKPDQCLWIHLQVCHICYDDNYFSNKYHTGGQFEAYIASEKACN